MTSRVEPGEPIAPTATRWTMRLAGWLQWRDTGLRVVRRAVRVTISACVGFYFCRLVLGDPTTALYAIFGTIALGALADVSGAPAQRTRTYAAALVAGLVLVSLGTLLAFSTLAAATGMLLIGFAIAFSGIGGPRPTSVANALQLLYILPCFPPFAPDTLPERLLGLVIGIGLLAIADRVLWPDPAPPRFSELLARSAESTARYATGVSEALRARDPTAALSSAELTALGDAATESSARLRPALVPVSERPAGPGLRDRSLTYAVSEIKMITGRLGALVALLSDAREPVAAQAAPSIAALVRAVGQSLGEVGHALAGTASSLELVELDTAIAVHRAQRTMVLAVAGEVPEARLRAGVAIEAIADATRGLVLAARGATGAPVAADPGATEPAGLWFLTASPWQRWWRRVRVHATPRSVYLQNAIRIAVGLTAARVIAEVFKLTHGFWVLLATLSLMRTSVGASRAALVPAFAGTVLGAAMAGALLAVIGADTTAYAWILPPVMLVALAAGPLLGLAAAQGGFTLIVALLFAQLAPTSWQLAEVRLVDVVVGGLVGLLIGAAIWPRGGAGELRKVAAAALRAGADDIVATSRWLAGAAPTAEPAARVSRLGQLFDITYGQFRSEPEGQSANLDWMAVGGVAHRLADDVVRLRRRYPGDDPLPWPERADELCAAGSELAEAYRTVAGAVHDGRPPPALAAGIRADFAARRRPVSFTTNPSAAMRVLDSWGWLHGLVEDLAGVEQAMTPVAQPDASVGGRSMRSPGEASKRGLPG